MSSSRIRITFWKFVTFYRHYVYEWCAMFWSQSKVLLLFIAILNRSANDDVLQKQYGRQQHCEKCTKRSENKLRWSRFFAMLCNNNISAQFEIFIRQSLVRWHTSIITLVHFQRQLKFFFKKFIKYIVVRDLHQDTITSHHAIYPNITNWNI